MLSPKPDMWYLEGIYELNINDMKSSQDFIERTKSLAIKEVFANQSKGIRIKLLFPQQTTDNHVVVYSFSNDILFIRRVMGTDAIDWVLEHVPE